MMSRVKKLQLIRYQKEKIKEAQRIELKNEETKAFLAIRKKKRKTETPERAKKFFEERNDRWQSQRNHDNVAVPSVITKEGGKCTKKKSPLDLY